MKKFSVLLAVILLITALPAATLAAPASAPAEGKAGPQPGTVMVLKIGATGLYNPCTSSWNGDDWPVESFRRGERVTVAPPHPSGGSNSACGRTRVVSAKTGEVSWLASWLLKPSR